MAADLRDHRLISTLAEMEGQAYLLSGRILKCTAGGGAGHFYLSMFHIQCVREMCTAILLFKTLQRKDG